METSTQVFDFWDVSPEEKKGPQSNLVFKFQKEFLIMSQICQDTCNQNSEKSVLSTYVLILGETSEAKLISYVQTRNWEFVSWAIKPLSNELFLCESKHWLRS